MVAALMLPQVLDRLSDRLVMLCGGGVLVAGLITIGLSSLSGPARWWTFLGIWFVLGLSYSGVLTPSGRLLKRSSHQQDRPAIFAAHFALSHACWLITYPLAGWMGAELGLAWTCLALAVVAAGGTIAALYLWPAMDKAILVHTHTELPGDHPHVQDAQRTRAGLQHTHAFVIDEYHHYWPSRG
jgi:MFS family permease